MVFKHLSLLALSPLSLAAPLAARQEGSMYGRVVDPWDAGATHQFPIHPSCNVSEVTQIRKAIDDMFVVAEHAIDHMLRYGNESALFVKWFGNASTAEPIGWYNRLARADRTGFHFRCDDPDDYCDEPDYSGYWRGEEGPEDVAICSLYYDLLPLEAICTHGYTIANSPITSVQVTDLMHRMFHVPSVSELVVDHYGDLYTGSLDLAKTDPVLSVRNSDSLQFFALEAYTYEIAVPGVGCPGNAQEASEQYDLYLASSAAAAEATTTPSSTVSPSATATSSAAENCHTHANGEVHCI